MVLGIHSNCLHLFLSASVRPRAVYGKNSKKAEHERGQLKVSRRLRAANLVRLFIALSPNLTFFFVTLRILRAFDSFCVLRYRTYRTISIKRAPFFCNFLKLIIKCKMSSGNVLKRNNFYLTGEYFHE